MQPPLTSKKIIGQATRGKTASNRLRRVDNFILLYERSLLTRNDGLFSDSLFVDLGYGFDARTTLESAARFRQVNPDLRILGVEIDKERVEAALPYADDKTFFRLGGFNLPLQEGETVRLIRAFNVLHQYKEKDFIPAYEKLTQYILPGGLMIEGTSNPFGSIWCANVVRKTNSNDVTLSETTLAPHAHLPRAQVPGSAGESLNHRSMETLRSLYSLRVTTEWNFEALVFSTNFRSGFNVEEFQTILPKNLIHRMVAGQLIYDFFEAWKRAAAKTSAAQTYGSKQWFALAAENLARKGFKIDLHRKWLSKGWMIWKLG